MPQPSKLNVKRLVLVIVVLGGLGVILAGAYLYRAHRVAAAFRKFRSDGLAADASGDRAKAVDLLGQYLARYPNDLPALIVYSKDRPLVASADNQNIVQAIQSLRYALRLDPTLIEQRRELMHLYVRTGYATEAMESADTLLAANPRDLDALATRTRSLIRLRRLPEALAAATAWTDADPNAVDARLVRIELLNQTQHPKDQAVALADTWSKQLASKNDGSAELLRGHTLLVFGDPAGASADLKLAAAAAVKRLPPKAAGLALAMDLDAIHEPDLSFAVLLALWKADPTDVDLRMNLARRDFEKQRFTDVVDLIGGIPDHSAVNSSMLAVQAMSLLDLKRDAEVEPVRRELAKRTDDFSAAWVVLLTQLSAPRFDAPAVVAAARPVVDRQDDPYLRFVLGEAYNRLGERDQAVRQWQRVVVTDLGWAQPAVQLCIALTELGQPEDAFNAGAEAVRRAPRNVDALVALAGAWTSAIQAGKSTTADGCLHLIEQLSQQLPGDGRLPPLHAAVLAAMNRPTDAAAVIQAAVAGLQHFPSITWERLAAVSQSAGLKLEAACYAREQQHGGLTASLAYAKAAGLLAAGQPAAGLSSFDADRTAAAGNPAAASDVNWSIDRALYLDAIHDPGALAAWQAVGDAHPADISVQQSAVAAVSVRADPPTFRTAVARLGALTANQGSAYELGRSRYLVSYGTTPAEADEARTLLDQLLRDSPDSIDAHLLSARAYEVANHPADAVADLRAVLQKMPQAAAIHLAVAQLLQRQGDFDGAREQLSSLTADELTPDQRRQAAVLLSQQGDADRAIAMLQTGTSTDADPAAQLTLANLYLQNNDPARAEAVGRQVVDQHPDVASVQFLANLLANQGRLDEARAVLEKLSDPHTAGTGNGAAELARGDFALHFESAGPAAQSKALALFAAATAAGPTNATAWQGRVAAELLTGHADAALAVAADGLKLVPSDPALLAVSHHAAAVTAADAQPDLRPILLALLRDPANAAAPAATLDALYDADVNHQPLSAVTARLGELLERFPQFAPLHLQLIGLYERAGRNDDAAAAAARAAEALPQNSQLIRIQTDLLAKTNRWSEVLSVASRWHDRFPSEALSADAAKADALLHLDRAADALVTLQPYADHPGTPAYDRVLPLLAQARQASGQSDTAALMEPLLTQGATGRASYMQYAANTLPPVEADVWIRRAVAAMPPTDPDEHIGASDAYLHLADKSTGPDAARFAAASLEMLGPCLAMDPPNPNVLLAAASRNERLNNVDAAADLYRRVLSISPGQPIAENNLAMILARAGHADQARPLIDAAVKSMPQASDLYDTQAFVLGTAGHTDDALVAIGQALRLDPGRVSFHVRQITLLADANRTREAVDALHALDSLSYDPATVPPETLKRLQDLRDRLSKAPPPAHGVT